MLYESSNETETEAIGKKLAETFSGGEIVLLQGDLGAGKTVFTKGIAQGLGVRDTVVSPTFNLMNEYDGRLKLYHYDAYRLGSAREAEEAGLCEYFGNRDGVCVIEWASNIAQALKAFKTVTVNIVSKNDDERLIEIVDE